jgi:acyl carrier protein
VPPIDPPDGDDRDGFHAFAELVGRHVGIDLSAAGAESLLRDDLGFDSLVMAEAVVLLADRGAVLPDELISELHTLGDLHHYARVLAPPGSGDTDPMSRPSGPVVMTTVGTMT